MALNAVEFNRGLELPSIMLEGDSLQVVARSRTRTRIGAGMDIS